MARREGGREEQCTAGAEEQGRATEAEEDAEAEAKGMTRWGRRLRVLPFPNGNSMDDALTVEGAIECLYDILNDEDSGFSTVEMLGMLEVVKAMILADAGEAEGDGEEEEGEGEEPEPEACPTIRTAI